MTERAQYVFTVKEHDGGAPWLMLDLLRRPDIEILKHQMIGLDLRPGTTLEDAKELASILNAKVSHLTCTDISKL
jgi:hypothetical protein